MDHQTETIHRLREVIADAKMLLTKACATLSVIENPLATNFLESNKSLLETLLDGNKARPEIQNASETESGL